MRALLPVVLVAASAAAQQSPLAGVQQPFEDVAATEHADSVETNPAGLGFGNPFDLGYTFTRSGGDEPGQGHSVFLSVGALDPYHTGIGLQFLDRADSSGTPVKFSWGHALQLSPALSFGFTWHTFTSDDDPALDGLDTWDLGVQVRPWRWVATGLMVSDVTTPVLGSLTDGDMELRGRQRVPRAYTAAVALRPGTERLNVTGTMRLAETGDDQLSFGGRMYWRLFGSFALVARYDAIGEQNEQHRLMVGLADVGQLGVGVFYYSPDVADSKHGVAATVRLRSHTEPQPELLPRPLVVEVAVASAAEYGPGGLIFASEPATPWLNLLLTLRALEQRDEVSAIILSFGDVDFGWAQAAELRDAIKSLRAAGKEVHAWLPVGDTRSYSVASAANRIYTAPAGGLLLTGMRGELLYAGDAVQRLGVKAEFVAVGDYKSAPETFTRTGPSDAAREVQNSLMDDVYARTVGHIAEGRGVDEEKVRKLVDEGPYTADAAMAAGLVDKVMHYDEFDEAMRKVYGGGVRFARSADVLDDRDPRWGEVPSVGVLYAVGTITDGESVVNPLTGALSTGAQTFVEATRRMREDPSVRAVVLRIDSPGGSVTAADAMWRELDRLAEVKPLYVSMGDVAASGGYYIAAPAREILASPETITGSIGVFTGKFDLSGLYGLLGLRTEVFLRGKRAGLLSNHTSWTDDEREAVKGAMERLYDLFLERVADGRSNLDKEQVAPLARGRVWTGQQARGCGLVDRPAGLLTAIDLAARSAGFGHGDYRLAIGPPAGGFGGLPTNPLGRGVAWAAEALGARADEPAALPAPLRALLDIPALAFADGTPLALLPYVWVER